MNDILRALLMAAGILLPVIILIIGLSIVTVKRGEASHGAGHEAHEESAHVSEAAGAAAAAKPAKAAAGPVSDEISVPQILFIGMGLFVLTILALLGLSLVQHM